MSWRTLPASNSSTCGLMESFLVNETPSASTDSLRTKPKVFGGTVESRLHLGDNTISVDLIRFNCKLLLQANDSILFISDTQDEKFEAGTTS